MHLDDRSASVDDANVKVMLTKCIDDFVRRNAETDSAKRFDCRVDLAEWEQQVNVSVSTFNDVVEDSACQTCSLEYNGMHAVTPEYSQHCIALQLMEECAAALGTKHVVQFARCRFWKVREPREAMQRREGESEYTMTNGKIDEVRPWFVVFKNVEMPGDDAEVRLPTARL